VRRLPKVVLLASLCALLLAPAASADVLLGVKGDRARMRALTGQRSDGSLTFWGWNQGRSWGRRFDSAFPILGRVPIVTIGTNSRSGREAITPRGIARGAGDRYLRSLNRAIHTWGGPVIFRPLAEMNGHWTYYSAYNANGSHRGKAHSQKNFRRAFKRIYLILHGGDRATINRKLANSRMPGISVDLPENPRPRLRVLWNPQGFGSPDVPGNRAHVYYPGDAFVDIVGNDIYDIRFRYAWDANRALFRRYRHKPYALGEFGLWGIDDPSFIRRVGRFIRTHSRVKLAIYYDSQRGSIWDLGSKPRSRAAYRRYITPLNR
jgi:mannan endo-1,4-beta-mannosidase